jgi:hypothetical protein
MIPERDQDHPLAPLLMPRTAPEPLPEKKVPPVFPWEDGSLGPGPSLGRTLKGTLFSPHRFFEDHRPGRTLAAPFIFGLAAGSTGFMLALFRPVLVSLLSPEPMGRAAQGSGTSVAGTVALLFLTPLVVLVWMAFQAVWSHLWLMLFGAGKNGLQATLRALSYSMSAALFFWLPYVGPILGTIWGLTIWIVGLSRLQERSLGRIATALFLPPLGIYFLLAYLGGGFG